MPDQYNRRKAVQAIAVAAAGIIGNPVFAQSARERLRDNPTLAESRAPRRTRPIPPDETVLPRDTDPDILTFNNPQAVYHPRAKPRNQLLIWLAGTNGQRPGALRLSVNAAVLGYHVIHPMYPDDVPATACAHDDDPEAFAKFRWAIIEGGSSPHLKRTIIRAESIENRTIKLLQYLEHRHPNQNWGQFLKDGDIDWGKIVISGGSQGGGHAALIATKHAVARVLCFAAPKDYSLRLRAPAAWYDSSVTPAARYFAFNNTHDKQGSDNQQQIENLTRLGVVQVGGIGDADTEQRPFHRAHALFTSWPGPDAKINSITAHESVLSDLPWRGNAPLFKPVWDYMLASPLRA